VTVENQDAFVLSLNASVILNGCSDQLTKIFPC